MKYYDLMLVPRLRRGMTWALVSGAGCGALGAVLGRQLDPTATTATIGLAAGVLFLLAAAPMAAAALVLYHLRENSDQIQHLIAIRPLLGELPPPLGGWSIDPRFGSLLVQMINELRPNVVLECGAGTSTVITAAAVQKMGHGQLVTLENDAGVAEQTRRRLRQQGLDGCSRVITAPLQEYTIDGQTRRWYALDELDLNGSEIDLLVVDGPHGKGARLARYPAVPLLRSRLAADVCVVMDDGSRPDERKIAGLWSNSLGASKKYIAGGRGVWILQRTSG